MSKFGKRLIQAAKEAQAIARGTADPRTYRVHVPADIDVAAIRNGLGLSQGEFAGRFGIPVATLRDWEQGRRKPEGPARVLLLVIREEPKAVKRALDHAARKLAAA
jgi:putative transcriptional regulator